MGDVMKRFGLAAVAALAIAAAAPASAQQVLKVRATPTGIPFTFLDTKTNTIQGIMVDLVTEVGKDAGFNVQIEPMQFSALIPSLTSSKIDIIAAAMFITAPRKEVVDFSDPIYTYGEGLVVPKSDAKAYTTQDDLKGETVGAQVGTAFVDALKKSGLFADVKAYDTIPDILRDVNTGRLKAGYADYPILAYNLKQGGFPEVRLVAGYKPVTVGSVGSLLLSTVRGLIWAMMRVSGSKALSMLSASLINVIRGIPIIVLLFYLYFVMPDLGVTLSALQAAILGLGIAYSAYQAENFRAGIEAIDKGQIEAAQSIGMGWWLTMRRVVLPQAVRIVLPPYGNVMILMLKDSSLASTITVAELAQQGKLIASTTFKNTNVNTLVALMYLPMSIPLILLFRHFEYLAGKR